MNRNKMAKRLKKLRNDKTQAEVAAAVGISSSAYAMYETGQRIPRDDVKIKIAEYFKTSVAYIFF